MPPGALIQAADVGGGFKFFAGYYYELEAGTTFGNYS